MAKATTAVKKIITIDLSEQEAAYLQDLLQNYLGATFEKKEHYDIRRMLFEVLKQARQEKA